MKVRGTNNAGPRSVIVSNCYPKESVGGRRRVVGRSQIVCIVTGKSGK